MILHTAHGNIIFQSAIKIDIALTQVPYLYDIFVSYYDVSKSLDTVWIEGLCWQIYKKGLDGKLWRLMYHSYLDFNFCVRIDGKLSRCYPMLCEIHLKYTALIVELECSGLCCIIYGINSSPASHTDYLAAVTSS